MNEPCRIVVLISGKGSNLQTLIDDQRNNKLPIKIEAVISNRRDAFGLQRAQQSGIPTSIVNHTDFIDRQSFDQSLINTIEQYQPDLVVLAGFMRILTGEFVRHYKGRLLNIHPSLLPKYQGLNTHQRAIDAGDTNHGVTVHFVTEELDGGPAIIQATVPIMKNDTVETLAQRVQTQEHIIYPIAIHWFASKRLTIKQNNVMLDGEPLPPNGYQIT